MEKKKHWAESLQIGDRVIANIRHPNDGRFNQNNVSVIVVENDDRKKKIKAVTQGSFYYIPYNELSPNRS